MLIIRKSIFCQKVRVEVMIMVSFILLSLKQSYCKYRFCLVFASKTQSLSIWPRLFVKQCPPAPAIRQSWWASNSGGQLHCNATLSRGQWFLPMWKCKYQGVNCHSHLLAMTVGCLPFCPESLGRAALTCQCQTQSNIPHGSEIIFQYGNANFKG